jgi:hypothetical protein
MFIFWGEESIITLLTVSDFLAWNGNTHLENVTINLAR